jgi:hypothetical protein
MSLPLPLVPRAPVPLGREKGIILALVQLNIEILPRRTDHVTGGVLGGNLVDGDAVNTWGGDGLLRGVESSTEVSGVVRVLIAGASATDGSGGGLRVPCPCIPCCVMGERKGKRSQDAR